MSTPTTPEGPAEEPGATPAGPPPLYGPPSQQPYPPHPPSVAGPFAPRPREPWFNPVKRGAITAAAIVLALVLFGGGIVIGAVVADEHGGSHPRLGPLGNHQERGFGRANPGRPGFGHRPGFGPGHLPPRPGNPASAAPSPAPSTSHS